MIIASFFFVNKLEAKLSLNSHEYTVNQLKFATTLFRDFQKKYWFAATNICNQDRDYGIWKRNYQRQLSTDSRQEIFATTSLS